MKGTQSVLAQRELDDRDALTRLADFCQEKAKLFSSTSARSLSVFPINRDRRPLFAVLQSQTNSYPIILLSLLSIEKFLLMASARLVASINFMVTQRRQLILTDEHIDDLRDMTNSNLCTLESDFSPLPRWVNGFYSHRSSSVISLIGHAAQIVSLEGLAKKRAYSAENTSPIAFFA